MVEEKVMKVSSIFTIQGNGRTEKSMDMVICNIRINIFMKEHLAIIFETDLEYRSSLMEIDIKDNIRMENLMERENMFGEMELNTKVCSIWD
jgi:hypothetical protein